MSINKLITQSGNDLLKGFSNGDLFTTEIIVTLLVAYLIAMYIHMVYRFITKNTFYFKNYAISMTIMSVITAGIIMAMQSSLVISLGMVGALSIVRFRTAIKDPLDLLFLFWSISVGIICGARLYEMAVLVSVVATVGIMVFQIMPVRKDTCLLVLNASDKGVFDQVIETLKKDRVAYSIKAKNSSRDGLELIMEVRLKNGEDKVTDHLLEINDVEAVYLMENDVDLKA